MQVYGQGFWNKKKLIWKADSILTELNCYECKTLSLNFIYYLKYTSMLTTQENQENSNYISRNFLIILILDFLEFLDFWDFLDIPSFSWNAWFLNLDFLKHFLDFLETKGVVAIHLSRCTIRLSLVCRSIVNVSGIKKIYLKGR